MVVESPAKAKKIQTYLGSAYQVVIAMMLATALLSQHPKRSTRIHIVHCQSLTGLVNFGPGCIVLHQQFLAAAMPDRFLTGLSYYQLER